MEQSFKVQCHRIQTRLDRITVFKIQIFGFAFQELNVMIHTLSPFTWHIKRALSPATHLAPAVHAEPVVKPAYFSFGSCFAQFLEALLLPCGHFQLQVDLFWAVDGPLTQFSCGEVVCGIFCGIHIFLNTEQNGECCPPRKLLIVSQPSQHRAALRDWLHSTGRYHGCVFCSGGHPQSPGDCGHSEAQTTEAATQLWPG